MLFFLRTHGPRGQGPNPPDYIDSQRLFWLTALTSQAEVAAALVAV